MVSFDFTWWRAQVFLGLKLMRHYFVKLWPWRRRFGYKRFVDNYVAEGALPFSAQHRAIAYLASHCTTCGLCDQACVRVQSQSSTWVGPMKLVVSGLRGGELAACVTPMIESLLEGDCSECQACERVCPQGIPIVQLARYAAEQLAVVQGASRRETSARA